jgi:hypothetical protein
MNLFNITDEYEYCNIFSFMIDEKDIILVNDELNPDDNFYLLKSYYPEKLRIIISNTCRQYIGLYRLWHNSWLEYEAIEIWGQRGDPEKRFIYLRPTFEYVLK